MLLLLPWVVVLILVRHHHHLDSGSVGIAAAFSVGLPTLWVTWAAFRDERRSGVANGGPGIAALADTLAAAVGTQWNREAAVRRLNDPYPLAISWAAADPSLTDAWDSLVRLAVSGAGRLPLSPDRAWAAGPDDLAGEGSELADVLARVPTGRLIVLGEPGAGKTMLMVRLVLDLLARRTAGGPVPFLTSVASWDPSGQDLRDWLITRLVIDYPALAGPPPADAAGSTRAAALLAAGLILPVLDGLDEIPDRVRGPAISQINEALPRPGDQLVVTCRTQQYRDAVRPQGGPEVTLRAAAAVQLRPLDVDAVRDYLSDDAAGPDARARWAPVFAVLGTEAPAAQALGTPLMVGLARAIYNPRPGELGSPLRDPVELCSPSLLDRRAVEFLLFDAFIPAAYRLPARSRWTAGQAEIWLTCLARQLQADRSPDLAWWQLAGSSRAPARGIGMTTIGLVAGPVAGLTVGLAFGLPFGFMAGLMVLFLFGIAPVEGDLTRATSPEAGLADDRKAALLIVITGMFAFGTAVGLVVGLPFGLAFGIAAGLAAGLVAGSWASLYLSAWPSYMLARGWLALRHELPWSLMDFLADAHRRGVLRQVGAVYQFRHINLQRRLAAYERNQA